MSIIYNERGSDSPYVASITSGYAVQDGFALRPADFHWHMVVVRAERKVQLLVVGPLTAPGKVTWSKNAEILWIKFEPGTYIPHLPTQTLLDKETVLPAAANNSIWLNDTAWQLPTAENADLFVQKLAYTKAILRDPVIKDALQGQVNVPARTMRYHFLRSTGLTHGCIHQIERAQRAVALLRQGVSIADTMFEAGYYDQAHLTKSLVRWIGYTPTQVIQQDNPQVHNISP